MSAKFEERNFRLSELGRQFSDSTVLLHDAIAKKVGLSSADHKYLGILVQNGAMTAGEFSQKIGLTTGATTGLIDRLEAKDLIRRVSDNDDRRKIRLVPNHKNAIKLLGDIFGQLQSKMVSITTQFTAAEIKIIEKYLLLTIDVMRETKDDLQK